MAVKVITNQSLVEKGSIYPVKGHALTETLEFLPLTSGVELIKDQEAID